jgi:ATP synthase protein I
VLEWPVSKPEESKGEDEALKARLEKLSTALETQRKVSQQRKGASDRVDLSGGSVGQAMSLGFRVLSEFVAAIIVGTLMGWQFDIWFGTAPALLIVFLAFGTAAGFWNVYRIAAKPVDPPQKSDKA